MFKTLLRRLAEAILPYSMLRFIGFIYGYLVPKSVSFSQKGEDLLCLAYFAKRGIKQGIYLDIGCFHPTWISNTHLLHKQGWQGHAVDIDEFKLKAMRISRGRKVQTHLGAVFAGSDENATGTIYKFRRIWSDIDTLDKATAEEYRDNNCGEFGEEQIKLIDINQLLDQLPKVNFINIDIEGVDSTVIKNLDFKKFSPDAILFEDNHNWDGSAEVVRILHKHGYKHLFTSGGSICYAQPL